MEDNASSQMPEHETALNTLVERINLDGNSIISTPDKLQLDMAAVDNLRLATTSLSVLSEKDEIDFLGSSAKTLHKTISDYVDQNFGTHRNHLLAQCSYDLNHSPLLKYRHHPQKTKKRQKPVKDPSGKSEPTAQPPKDCPIKICRPGYKGPVERRKSRMLTKDDLTTSTTEKPRVESFKASDRSNFEFKPSVLTLVDKGPVKVRKIQRSGAKPKPFKGDIKENKSSKLRFEYNRKQGTVPSHLQAHLDKYKKPPFRKAIPHPRACFEDIVERLHKLKKISPSKGGVSTSRTKTADKTTKSHKPKRAKKREAPKSPK